MKKRKRLPRIRWRKDRECFVGDFRAFKDVGGGQEALIPEGSHRGTTNEVQAHILFAYRLRYYEDKRAGRLVDPPSADPPAPVPTLMEFLPRHQALKEAEDEARPYTIVRERDRIERLVVGIRGDARLDVIDTKWVNNLVLSLKRRAGRRPGTKFSAQSINHVLNALSSLLGNAVSEGVLASNPVHDAKRPRIRRGESSYLESHDAHALLEAATKILPADGYRGLPHADALLATALHTGGRRGELFALLVQDVDFDNGRIWFRPNEWYGERKSRTANRSVPLWPALRRALVPVVGQRQRGLLFPSSTGRMVTDLRAFVNRVFAKARVERPVGQCWHLFRHTYTAHRLQTMDNRQPVSVWTVARELGHKSVAQIEDTYGYLLDVRHRTEVVEYRPKQETKRHSRSA